MSRASGTSASKPGVPGGTIRAMGCWCPVGTVKHRPRRQPRPAATAAPVLTASARPRRRRVKVFSQGFFKKLARCGAALHDLNRRSRWKKSRATPARRAAHRARPGLCATPRGGHPSPLFGSMGRRWLRPRTPGRPKGSALHPAAFEKAGKTFTFLSQTQARAFGLASLRKPRRLKAACATCPVRPRTA